MTPRQRPILLFKLDDARWIGALASFNRDQNRRKQIRYWHVNRKEGQAESFRLTQALTKSDQSYRTAGIASESVCRLLWTADGIIRFFRPSRP